MELLILFTSAVLSLGLFILPVKFKYQWGLLLHLLIIGASSWLAWQSIATSQANTITLLGSMGTIRFSLDSLAAYFLLVINFTALTAVLYANGYLKPYREKKSALEFSVHHFALFWLHFSMLLVVMFQEGLSFLIAWELMSVSSFFLVIFEGEKKENLRIGLNYLIQMHVGVLLLLGAFLYVQGQGEAFGFIGLAHFFATHPVLPVFITLFIGFGIKAGFMPFHTWLPHAHPAAPSYVSGMMSGVMIKMGIYGILRVLTFVHTDLMTVGLFVLGISLISGLLGVMNAIVQHDFKKLLAYHSIENIGIIGIGIGVGVIGLAMNIPALAALGFTGGILHILNHSLFKSLLFYAAGSVYSQTHTRYVEHLGGLIKKMPKTAILFLIGSVSICGLPPFNGFISEFLIYLGLFKAFTSGNLTTDILMLATVLGLTLIGGLALFCFTKVFSIIFLGSPRSKVVEHAEEVSSDMIFPKTLVAIMIVAIGLAPVFFVKIVAKVTALYVPNLMPVQDSFGTLQQVGIAGLVFIGIVAVLVLIRISQQKKAIVEHGPTWGCGYSGADGAVHQYTATSYAENFKDLAGSIVGVAKHYHPFEEEEIFPQPRKFETHSHDVFEAALITKPTDKLNELAQKAAVFQSGRLNDYLLYAFVFLGAVFLLTYLGVL